MAALGLAAARNTRLETQVSGSTLCATPKLMQAVRKWLEEARWVAVLTGRKMGHLTALNHDSEQAYQAVMHARRSLTR